MRFAVCRVFPELPWLHDRDQVPELDRIRMVGVCRSCGVVEACAAFVTDEQITGGFWAAEFRDQPDLPDHAISEPTTELITGCSSDSAVDASPVEHRDEGEPVAS